VESVGVKKKSSDMVESFYENSEKFLGGTIALGLLKWGETLFLRGRGGN